jgi:hypothetical protein
MDNNTLKNIFEFLKNKEGKKHRQQDTLFWKLRFNEPLTKEELTVDGDLSVSNTRITSLPEGLKVSGGLDISYTKMTSLPEGLKVRGDLDLVMTDITSLPKGLKVGGDLNIRGTELIIYSNDELRKMIEPGFIKGNIIR